MSNSIRQTAGVLARELVRGVPPRIPRETIARFEALEDLSGTISDVLDDLGLRGVVGASILKPTILTGRIIGPAITVRSVAQELDAYASATSRSNRMTEVEGIAQAEPGDVLVIQGMADTSNMGGIMATLAKRQGIVGAVVDGGVRDVGQSRGIGFPVWSRDISPITGKWRCVTVEVNGPITVAGLAVRAGDLIVADETGTCVVPRERVDEVLVRAEAITQKERAVMASIAEGVSVQELTSRLFAITAK